jgi:Uma2 family endonuclease
MATTARLLTYDDLCRMPDDGRRYELIGGAIVVSPSPTFWHQELVFRVALLLRGYVLPRELGRVAIAPLDVRLSAHDVVQPDVIFISRERANILLDNGTAGPPDLVVEVLSPSTRETDLGRKMMLYAQSGVREYWIADRTVPRLYIYSREDSRFQEVRPVGHVVRSVILPGLEIDMQHLFSDFSEQ